MHSYLCFTCGQVYVGCVIRIWRQVDGGVWRSEESRLGECKHSEPLTQWHIVNSCSLQPKQQTACFPSHYCLSCHSLGSNVKIISIFLQAKNSTMTKINQVVSLNVVNFQTRQCFRWREGRAGGDWNRCAGVRNLYKTHHMSVPDWKLLLSLKLRDVTSNHNRH